MSQKLTDNDGASPKHPRASNSIVIPPWSIRPMQTDPQCIASHLQHFKLISQLFCIILQVFVDETGKQHTGSAAYKKWQRGSKVASKTKTKKSKSKGSKKPKKKFKFAKRR